jgi:hypothetical protein
MRRKKIAAIPKCATIITLALSFAANVYLIVHLMHVDIHVAPPILSSAFRTLRNTSKMVKMMTSFPSDLQGPMLSNISVDTPRFRDDERSTARPWLKEIILAALEAATGVFGWLSTLSSLIVDRCFGNLPCDYFSASFLRDLLNREPTQRRPSRPGFKRSFTPQPHPDPHMKYGNDVSYYSPVLF